MRKRRSAGGEKGGGRREEGGGRREMSVHLVGDKFARVAALLSPATFSSIYQSLRPSAVENIRMFGYSNTRKEDNRKIKKR